MSRYDLDGRVAIVTGASSGLGVEFGHALAESGAHVVLAARREDRITKLAEELEGRYGVRALPVRTDVAKESDVVGLVEKTVDALGTVDILVNNAGITIGRPLLEHTTGDWQRVIDVNLTAVFVASREAARVMIPKRSGSIVNISSVFGFRVTKQFKIPGYYASKGGVTMLTKALAAELGEHDIRVNAVAPTFFPTEMSAEMFGETEESKRLQEELLWPKTVLPELGRNEYVRGAVCFLASDDARYITGATLAVDGGWMVL